MHFDASTFQQALGGEVRRLRELRGWTRKDLIAHLPSDISIQALASYEVGTRRVSVPRLVEICIALDALPHDVLERAHEQMFPLAAVGRLNVDLRQVVRDHSPELMPLRRWASRRLASESGDTEVRLSVAAVEWLAELCGLDTVELLGRLHRLGVPR